MLDLIMTFGTTTEIERNKTQYKVFLDFLKDACTNNYLIQSEWD